MWSEQFTLTTRMVVQVVSPITLKKNARKMSKQIRLNQSSQGIYLFFRLAMCVCVIIQIIKLPLVITLFLCSCCLCHHFLPNYIPKNRGSSPKENQWGSTRSIGLRTRAPVFINLDWQYSLGKYVDEVRSILHLISFYCRF